MKVSLRSHDRRLQTVKKPMLLRENIRAAGEFEGARPASSWIIAIKKA